MRYLDKIDIMINKALMIAGGTALTGLMILATGNVAMRIFRIPFSGSYEIISFLGAVVTASALGYTQRNRDHIVVDILSEKFPRKVQKAVEAVSCMIIAFFFAMISWQTYLMGMRIRESGELSETLKIIYHPFVFGVSLGFSFLAIAGLIGFLKILFNGDKREKGAPRE